jgi:hypothetical protein
VSPLPPVISLTLVSPLTPVISLTLVLPLTPASLTLLIHYRPGKSDHRQYIYNNTGNKIMNQHHSC